MELPSELRIGLKEWASVCNAMEDGRQILLLRKGGIHESAGEFELEHPHFVLFPTYLHQNLKMLKESAHAGFQSLSAEPARVKLSAIGIVSDIIQLRTRAQMDALQDQHVWTSALIDMRFNHRPENPLYLLLVRAFRLAAPYMVENTPAYAGCKSWVPLTQPISTQGAVPILDDTAFDAHRRTIRQ